jgi:hypothetical protein
MCVYTGTVFSSPLITEVSWFYCFYSAEVPKLWGISWGDAVGSLGGGGQVACITRDIAIVNEIWEQGKIYILIGT